MNIEKKTQLFIIGIFLMLFIIFIFMIWYTSNIKIEEDRAKPDYQSYEIEEGFNIMMYGVEEYKKALAIYEGSLKALEYRIDMLYHLYFPKGSAHTVDLQLNALEQRLSMASFFGEDKGDE